MGVNGFNVPVMRSMRYECERLIDPAEETWVTHAGKVRGPLVMLWRVAGLGSETLR